MSITKRFKRVVSIILSTVIMFGILPVHIFAEEDPWEEYKENIPQTAPILKRQLRGAWISTVANLDWPSAKTRDIKNDTERIQKSKQELIGILDKSVELNLNALFFQVSPEGDAFYNSNIVPWSRYLTGTFGKNPGFDPLTFAIQEAHKRNIEIHAWFNPYRVSTSTKDTIKASLNVENSVYKEHPEWIKTSSDRFVVDPGIPEARQWAINRVMEVVNNYDVDGVHFDDYFYYEGVEGELKDTETFNKYNNGQFSNLGDWRRNNTYLLVKELSSEIRAKKTWVKFGISPSGIWDNKSDIHPDGSNTNSSYTNYGKCFADTKKWVEEEIIDYIAPQIYFAFANPRAPYGELANWWAGVCNGKKVHLYIGQALYKVNEESDPNFNGSNAVTELLNQFKFNAVTPGILGSIVFRFQNFNHSNKEQVVSAIKSQVWATKAFVPAMPWKVEKKPKSPEHGVLNAVSNGIKVTWNDSDSNTSYYALYRFKKGENIDILSDKSVLNLIATIRKSDGINEEFIDKGTTLKPNEVVYVVSSLDRLHNESNGLTISNSKSIYFSDVGVKYTWAIDPIDILYERGIVKGNNLGMFNPGYNTKRADFILMVVRALNLNADVKDNFLDVPKDSYYYDAIGVAKSLGIAKGVGDYFNPNDNITRQDMMVIMVRALEVSGMKIEKSGEEYLKVYNDAGLIKDYAREAVASLTKAELIQGSQGKVNPKKMATRAEIVVILHRVLNSVGSI